MINTNPKSSLPAKHALKINRAALIACSGCMLLVCSIGWHLVSSRPIYSSSHSHSGAKTHEHPHTHGEGLSHGHQHFGLVGTTTHSHPHQHAHRHDKNIEIPGVEGLTEIGHRHRSDSTIHFWATAEVVKNAVYLKCWTHRGQEVFELPPADCLADVFNGSDHVCSVAIRRLDGMNVGKLPADYFHLPTHVLKLAKLTVGDDEFDTIIPMEIR